MKVFGQDFEMWGDKTPICISTNYIFRYECAQHTTTGDFRTEDGFSPELEINPSIQELKCNTKDKESMENDGKYRYRRNSDLPSNYNSLGHGILTIKDISKETNPEFNI
jgi:hypothetical protein